MCPLQLKPMALKQRGLGGAKQAQLHLQSSQAGSVSSQTGSVSSQAGSMSSQTGSVSSQTGNVSSQAGSVSYQPEVSPLRASSGPGHTAQPTAVALAQHVGFQAGQCEEVTVWHTHH